MAAVDFVFGLIVGLGFYAWKRNQFKRQLRVMLQSFSPRGDWVSSLPPISLIRRELTSVYQQKQQLEQQLQIWQDLIDRSPTGFLRVDQENRLLWCNQKARQLLNIDRWQPGQIRLLLELVRSYELDRLIEQTRQSQQKQKQEWTFYYTNYREQLQNQGSSAEAFSPVEKKIDSLALKGYSIPLPEGQVGIFILDRQALVDLSKSREEAFADLTHELRTPLTSIALVAENLLNRLDYPERRWVEQMLQEINRLIRLVQEWLDLTQLQSAPNQSLNYTAIELRELIDSVWRSLKPLADKKEVTLVYSGAEQVNLEADRSRLIQVLLNLLDNAIKHSPQGKEILVEVNPSTYNNASGIEEAGIEINIIDSGNGFTPADLPYVFERLYRGDKSRTRQGYTEKASTSSGSGLGLAIAKQIIEAHQGYTEANNHPETKGAWLKFVLPLTETRESVLSKTKKQ